MQEMKPKDKVMMQDLSWLILFFNGENSKIEKKTI